MTGVKGCKRRPSERESRVVAAKKQQRLAGIQCSGKNFAYDDGVVTGNMRRMQAAGDLAKNVVHQRNTLRRPNKIHTHARLVLLRLIGEREKFRKLLLVFP